jgi:hypothetical protein
MPFLRQRQLDELIEAIDHLATVNADLIDVINRAVGMWEAKNAPVRLVTGGWRPGQPTNTLLRDMSPERVTAARTEALGIVDEVHRAQDRNDDAPLLDDDTPTEKEACS